MDVARRRGALALVLCLLALAGATVLSARFVEPFHTWYYQFAWYLVLPALDAAMVVRTGKPALFGDRRFAFALFAWSAPVWFVFELANFRLANWYYVFVVEERWLHWPATFAAFATVLPAIFLAEKWLENLRIGDRLRGPSFELRSVHLGLIVAAGVGFVTLALWRPLIFFPLIWGAFTLLLEPWNYRREPSESLLGDIASGRYGRIVRLLLAGAAIGLFWESLNSVAGARWIYTVPGLEELKLFEMPLLGFLGFPVFALDCYVMYTALAGLGLAPDKWRAGAAEPVARAAEPVAGGRAAPPPVESPARVRRAILAAAAFCVLVLGGMDRWTVDSYRPRVGNLPGMDAPAAVRLRDAGASSVHAIAGLDSAGVAKVIEEQPDRAGEIVRAARLAITRGIGTLNARALLGGGIEDLCELAGARQEDVSAAVRRLRDQPYAGRAARVRVWIRAARAECENASLPEPQGRDILSSER